MTHLVTGCAGFIGVNLALRLIESGERVIGLDNLSRLGVTRNLDELQRAAQAGNFEFIRADVSDFDAMAGVFEKYPIEVVYHLAGQTAVTSSIENPRADFEANAKGTLAVLEAARHHRPKCQVIFASTNKVYGKMQSVSVVDRGGRYDYADLPGGINEQFPVDFHSPYGCSKGAADHYVRDYHRIYGMSTVVCRQSCIYGPRQIGLESQGWLAWLILSAIRGRTINIYGDGKQSRDVLYIDDLVDCYVRLAEAGGRVAGELFNVGGGPDNVMSILDLVDRLKKLTGREVDVRFADWRPGDQRVFISDLSHIGDRIGWAPRFGPGQGVERLFDWINAHRVELESLYHLNP